MVCRPCRVPPGARAAESDPARGVEPAYVCLERERVLAFLYLKVEDQREPYHDIAPAFAPKKRLKIGTLKVELNGFKLGERLLKVVFDNALVQRVDEIYVTIFPRSILKTPGSKRVDSSNIFWGSRSDMRSRLVRCGSTAPPSVLSNSSGCGRRSHSSICPRLSRRRPAETR